jgi:hypothetical protein
LSIDLVVGGIGWVTSLDGDLPRGLAHHLGLLTHHLRLLAHHLRLLAHHLRLLAHHLRLLTHHLRLGGRLTHHLGLNARLGHHLGLTRSLTHHLGLGGRLTHHLRCGDHGVCDSVSISVNCLDCIRVEDRDLNSGDDEDRYLDHGLEADWHLEAVSGWVDDGQDGQANSGPGSCSAACDSFELGPYCDEVLVLDDMAVGHWLGLLHHEGILRTVRLGHSFNGLTGSRRGKPDGIEVDSNHSIDIVRVIGSDSLLVLLLEGEELVEHIRPAPNGHLLLNTQANGGHR